MTKPVHDKTAIKNEANLLLLTQGVVDAASYLARTLFAGITDRSKKPYYDHLDRVAGGITGPDRLRAAGYLHDLIENIAGWSISDLQDIGFDNYVLDAVRAVTKVPGELYFDGIVRTGQTPQAISLKKSDLTDNSNFLRLPSLPSQNDIDEKKKYYLSFYYLDDVQKGVIRPGTPFIAWMMQQPVANQDCALLCRFSRHPDVLALAAGMRHSIPAPIIIQPPAP